MEPSGVAFVVAEHLEERVAPHYETALGIQDMHAVAGDCEQAPEALLRHSDLAEQSSALDGVARGSEADEDDEDEKAAAHQA